MVSVSRNCLVIRPVAIGVLVLLLGACSGGSDEDDDWSISASVSGLTASGLVLQYNGSGSIPVPSGATTVPITDIAADGSSYAVTILTQPSGLACSVANGTGTANSDVHNIVVSCSVPRTVGGTLSGYTGAGLVLRLNGQAGAAYNVSPASGDTSFTFAAGLATGGTYTVGVAAQPAPAQRCSVAGGSGTVGSQDVTSVAVTCVNNMPYTVGGTVTGLTGTGLSLRMRYTDATIHPVVNVPAGAPTFSFADQIPANGVFDIGILTQPAGQSCVLVRGRGASPQDVTNVAVTCVHNTSSTLVGTYSLLTTEGRQYFNFNSDGTFTTVLALHDQLCNTASIPGNGNGVEYGVFGWDSTTRVLNLPVVVVDTSGECGMSDGSVPRTNITIEKAMDTVIYQESGELPFTFSAVAAPSPLTSVVGAYVPEAGNGLLLVLHGDNTFLFAETQGAGGRFNTQERGCYAVSGTQITFTLDASCRPDNLNAYDFNGPYGLGPFPATPSIGPQPFTIESATVLVLNGTRWRRSLAN